MPALATTARGRLVGWPAATLVGAAFAVAMLGTTVPTPLYPTYAREFHFGELTTTVVFAVYAVGVIAALVLVGHWSDQVGRRPLLFGGLALSALSAAAFLVHGGVGWLYVGRLVSGLSAGIFTGTATATVVDLAPAEDRARASLVAAAVNMLGLGAGPLLAGILVEHAPAPTRLVFVVDLVLVALAVVAVVLVREPVERAARLDLAPRRLRVPPAVRPIFVRAAIAGFAGFAVTGLFTAVSPAFLGDLLHHRSPVLVGVVVVSAFLASVAGQVVSARLPLSRSLPGGCAMLIAGMALVAASLPARSLGLFVAGAVVAGLGQGATLRAGLAGIAADSPEELRGQVTSTFFVVLYVGIALPVVGEGALATAAGLVTAGVVFAVLVALLAATALVLLLRQGPRRA